MATLLRRRPSLLGRNRGDASEPGDVAGSPGKSSLFFVKDRVRGIGSSGDTEKVPVERRGSGGVRCAFGGPGKSGSGFRSSRAGPYPPSAAGLQGVQPLVDGINVGKGSRQNGSVPSEEGLAPRTGSVGPCPREARNRYGAVAFAPFALCVGEQGRGGPLANSAVVWAGRRRRPRGSCGESGVPCGASFHDERTAWSLFLLRGSSRCSFFLRSSREFAAGLRSRYLSVATGASVGEQNGSSPGSSWSATASSPSSGKAGASTAALGLRNERLSPPVAQRLSRRGGVRPAANGRLGTGTDRGNPTV